MFCNWTGPEILELLKPEVGKPDRAGPKFPTTGPDRTELKTEQTGPELKTGKKHPGDLTEAELYALGVSKRLNAKEVIVLHIYVNEEKDEPNERRFGEDEFDSIEKKFESFAEKIATWNPNDALSPDYSLGDWCNYCEFQETCAEFR